MGSAQEGRERQAEGGRLELGRRRGAGPRGGEVNGQGERAAPLLAPERSWRRRTTGPARVEVRDDGTGRSGRELVDPALGGGGRCTRRLEATWRGCPAKKRERGHEREHGEDGKKARRRGSRLRDQRRRHSGPRRRAASSRGSSPRAEPEASAVAGIRACAGLRWARRAAVKWGGAQTEVAGADWVRAAM